ncbi:hypothetical protein F7734_36385 [Scytonema sp. UIC 10036]|uniref:hypothetical protein n=1 Tax=Scytonema sp. UIC 10036 TaxID=2304196 RepID=UPI0012DAF116|nr:hypothetical protein [Scytonema sp. UIC 10036]MUG97510.1 hypothetical protein [Scytonema sp. UIC 10036]
MQAIENKVLFSEISAEESATVSGGVDVDFNLPGYLFIIGAATVFGQPGVSPAELQFAFETAVQVETI